MLLHSNLLSEIMQQNIDWSSVKRNDLGHWADETGISYQSLERCA